MPTLHHQYQHTEGMWKVVVGNVSRHVNDHYLTEFFSGIGVLQGSALFFPPLSVSPTGYAELLFARQDEAVAAGKMTGWSICNESIVVSSPEYCPPALRSAPVSGLSMEGHARKSSWEHPSALVGGRKDGLGVGGGGLGSQGEEWGEEVVERKNLYVLNLPIDMTNEEMLKLFQPYGTVVHSCILAILDSSARRRGFILMGSGVEATAAMRSLHGQVYRDYCLDVSYSVVQKTTPQRNGIAPSFEQQQQQATLRHSRSLSRAQPPAHHFDSLRALGQPVGRIGSEEDHDFWSGLPRGFSAVQQQQQVGGGGGGGWDARKPKRIITNGGASSSQGRDEVSVLVDNMSPTVFPTKEDIDALFKSFGRVLSVEIFPSLMDDRPNAAIVKYEIRAEAELAKRSLEGKAFGSREMRLSILGSPLLPGQPLSAGSSADWIAHSSTNNGQHAPNQLSTEHSTPTRLAFPGAGRSLGPQPKDLPSVVVKDAAQPVFDPFSATFGKPTLRSPPMFERQLSKDTVELCHPLPTDLSLFTAFPPPPHSFADTLTPRPHYSSPPPAARHHARHEGGQSYLRTTAIMRTTGPGDFGSFSSSPPGLASEGESEFSDGVSEEGINSPDSSVACGTTGGGPGGWWRKTSSASSTGGGALVHSLEKNAGGGAFFLAAGGGGGGKGEESDGLHTSFAGLGSGKLTEVVLGSALSSAL